MTGLEGKNNRFLLANQSKAHNANYQRILGARVSRTLEFYYLRRALCVSVLRSLGKGNDFYGGIL